MTTAAPTHTDPLFNPSLLDTAVPSSHRHVLRAWHEKKPDTVTRLVDADPDLVRDLLSALVRADLATGNSLDDLVKHAFRDMMLVLHANGVSALNGRLDAENIDAALTFMLHVGPQGSVPTPSLDEPDTLVLTDSLYQTPGSLGPLSSPLWHEPEEDVEVEEGEESVMVRAQRDLPKDYRLCTGGNAWAPDAFLDAWSSPVGKGLFLTVLHDALPDAGAWSTQIPVMKALLLGWNYLRKKDIQAFQNVMHLRTKEGVIEGQCFLRQDACFPEPSRGRRIRLN